MSRQRQILAVLILIFALSLIYSYYRMPRQKTVDKLKYTSGAVVEQARSGAVSQRDDRKVHLAELDKVRERFGGYRRNIFRELFAPVKKTGPQPSLRPVEKIPLPPPQVVPPPPVSTVVEPPPVMRDMARFTFLGFLKKDGRKTIFLAKDKEIFLVKKGDVISGKYEAANITDEALAIRVLADNSEIIIPLLENRALAIPGR